MLETGRAPGISFDGHLAIWSPSGWSGWQRGWLEAQHPWQWARGPPAPPGAAGVPAAQVPAQRGVRSPGLSLLTGTEVRLGGWGGGTDDGRTLLQAVGRGKIPHGPASASLW